MKKIIFILVCFLIIAPSLAYAIIGVGVATGKIFVNEKLRAGGIYQLPSFTVVNTGDEVSDYKVYVQHLMNQEELVPDYNWFSFQPQTFNLEPSKGQSVKVNLTLPLKNVQPGNYFAFLEAQPIKKSLGQGGASIGVAAATKLYFTIAPANFLQGIYYRIISCLNNYSPWTYIVLGLIVLVVLFYIIKKNFSFNIGINIKKKDDK
jgi:hypothetical protein